MTVLENLMIAQHNVLQEASRFSIAGMFCSRSYRRANDKAIENALTWLERLSVRELANKPAGDMPYGVQRRVEIARAIFFFNDTATTEIYTLSLHDALPI